jgi:hypothetical protein
MKAKKTIVWVVGLGIGVLAVVWLVGRLMEKPVISVDYVARLNELRKPQGYNPDDDGAELYRQACAAVSQTDIPEPRVARPHYIWPADMNDNDVKAIKGWLAENDSAMKTMEEAMAKKYRWLQLPDSKAGLVGVLVPYLAEAKQFCYAFMWRAKFKVSEGDVEGGLHDAMLAAGVANSSYESGRTTVEWLVGIATTTAGSSVAMEVVAHSDMSDHDLARLAAEIERTNQTCGTLATVIEYESFCFYDTVQRVYSDDGHGDGRLIPWALSDSGVFWGIPSSRRNAVSSLFGSMYMSRMISSQYGPIEGRKKTIEQWNELMAMMGKQSAMQRQQAGSGWSAINKESRKNGIVAFYGQSLVKLLELSTDHDNRTAGTLATIAVLRYQKARGTLPQGWQEVIDAGYLKEIPMDCFSGKPLVYAKTAVGFTVYGVGKDCKDDGGTDRKADTIIWPAEGQKIGK